MAQIDYTIRATGPLLSRPDIQATFDTEISAALVDLGAQAQRLVVLGAPAGVGSGGGGFRGSVFSELRGRPGTRSEVVGSPLVYAPVLEAGRSAGKRPPVGPILLWVRRKLGKTGREATQVAYLVARKIGARGYPGKFMFQRAATALAPIARARFETASVAIARKLGGA